MKKVSNLSAIVLALLMVVMTSCSYVESDVPKKARARRMVSL